MSSSWTTLHGWRGWRKVSRKLREGEVMSCSKSERMRRCGRESRPYILDSTEGGHGPGDFETFLGDASVLLQRNVLHQPVVLPRSEPRTSGHGHGDGSAHRGRGGALRRVAPAGAPGTVVGVGGVGRPPTSASDGP